MTTFLDNEDYIFKKEELRGKLELYYNDKRETLEKKLRNDRRIFCKQPTKSLIEGLQKRSNANEIRVYRRQDNKLTIDKSEILNDLFNYYQNLLGEEKVNER